MLRKKWSVQVLGGLVVFCLASLGLLAITGCRAPLYYYPQYNFAGRATPPSGLQQRVLATFTSNGSSGGAEILDGYRDIRNNVQNTVAAYSISGFSSETPSLITNYPEQQRGYILDTTTGNYTGVNYATEANLNTAGSFGANAPSAAAAVDGTRFIGAAVASSQVVVTATNGTYALNLPNVYRVAMNPGNTVLLAMTRNSNNLYRVIQLPQTSTPIFPPGYIDCQPLQLPVYCIMPVAGTYDRPTGAYFSLDGTKTYILNAGREAGGNSAGITVLQTSQVLVSTIPTVNPLASNAPSPLATLPVPNPVSIPGGVTTALSDGTNLYLAGQSLLPQTSTGALSSTPRADGLFSGYLTVLNETSFVPSNPVSISDGTHTRLLFADDNTLWVGASQCANGERAATGQNINCLTLVRLGGTTPTATIIPAVVQGGSATVPYPNTNGNLYNYGNLTGICWVQNYHKVYTAYGGQIHVFNTTDGSERDNSRVTVQGTVLDVAYMDALTNTAN